MSIFDAQDWERLWALGTKPGVHVPMPVPFDPPWPAWLGPPMFARPRPVDPPWITNLNRPRVPAPVTPPPVVTSVRVAPAPALVKQPDKPPTPVKYMIGNLGSDDPMALTDLDSKAIPRDMPRRANSKAPVVPIVFKGPSTDDSDLLTPEEWRREFERTWPGARKV